MNDIRHITIAVNIAKKLGKPFQPMQQESVDSRTAIYNTKVLTVSIYGEYVFMIYFLISNYFTMQCSCFSLEANRLME